MRPRSKAFRLLIISSLLAAACGKTAPPAPQPPSQAAAGPAAKPAAQQTPQPSSQPAQGAARPKEVLKLRLGLASSPAPALPNSVNWLAKDLGFYEREGLDVELVELRGTPGVITALRAGEIDVGNVNTEDVIRLTATKQLQMRAIHSPDDRFYFLIGAREGTRSPADLRGKNFGIARLGSLDHQMTETVLQKLGVNPGDVKWVAIGAPATRAQALAAGRIDATTVSVATWESVRKNPGLTVVVNSDDFFTAAPVVQKVNAVTAKALQEKPEHLRRFTAAIIKASRHFAENKQAWVDAMTKRRTDLAPDEVAGLWDQFKTAWAVNGLMNLEHYEKTAAFIYQSADFKDVPKISVQDWADTRLVDGVLKEIGVYDKFDHPGRTIR